LKYEDFTFEFKSNFQEESVPASEVQPFPAPGSDGESDRQCSPKIKDISSRQDSGIHLGLGSTDIKAVSVSVQL
jgi:hypothetical protein